MERKGLDISAYQKGIDFNRMDGIEFLILRAGFTGWGGDGTNKNKDSQFETFYNSAKAKGIPVGAYWYSCANTYEKGKAEAEYMYNNCLKGKQFEYPIYIDVEEERHQKVGKAQMNEAIKGFCEYLEARGYYVGIYASSYWFNTYIDTANLAQYDKWLANWTNKKPAFKYGEYGLWQNSASGSTAGYTVDTDVAYKDYPAIMKQYGLNGYPKSGEQPAPAPEPVVKTTDELAREVLDGKYGNGEARKQALGDRYNEVQARVNEMLGINKQPAKKSTDEIAKEVINGQWGNGDERKRRLAEAGYDYSTIQKRVNEMLGTQSQPAQRYHVVGKNDTLWGIAKKYYGDGSRYPEIARANGITNPDIIIDGQKLIIP